MHSSLNHDVKNHVYNFLPTTDSYSLASNNAAFLDSGCTGHFLKIDSHCTERRPTSDGIRVKLPNGSIIRATHTALLDMPQLPLAARQAHIFPDLHNSALVSISQFCDNNFEARFTKLQVQILDGHRVILTGQRDPCTGLWHIPLQMSPTSPTPTPSTDTPSPSANNIHELRTKQNIVQYLHQAAGSPVPSTWIKAIDSGFFTTWPGLTSDLVKKHLPKSLATAKGHLRQERQGLRSTQPSPVPLAIPDPEPNTRTHVVFMKPIEITGKIYSDQTGRFPLTSSRGNKYIMLVYDVDSNSITTEPLKSRNELELLRAYSKIHAHLTSCGLKPVLGTLDNEAPGRLKQFMKNSGMDYQLVPPHVHRRNAAERAISTWKDHFISILSSTDPNFPLHLWCRLIEQATTTLNLLRPSRINPRLSAEAQLNGAFDYNKTPLAPPGTRVLIHETPQNRRTWAAHGIEGWYLGRAAEHYRCYRVYATKTASERIASTVEFFPFHSVMPKTSSADAARDAASDLTHALLNPTPATPFAALGESQLHALRQLARIFAVAVDNPTVPVPRVVNTPPALPQLTPPVTAPRVAMILTPPPRVVLPTSTPSALPSTSPRPSTTPTTGPRPTSTPSVRPRPSPRPSTTPTTSPPPPARPNLITPDDDDPVRHRYPTRSQQTHAVNHVAKQLLSPDPHEPANSVTDPITGQVQEYRHLIKGPDKAVWETSFANELGRLAQGVGSRDKKGTGTIFFIKREEVPQGRQVTYGRIVSSIRPQKTETHRTRLTVGGDRLEYPGNVSTPTAKLTTAKCLINSTISTPDARFAVFDISNFYLGTPMDRYEYMRLPLSIIPAEIVAQYKLRDIATADGWVYTEIRRGMYGLKQAGLIANQQLQQHLAKFGYAPTPRTPGLWKHATRDIAFSLVVDDFGVKYVGRDNAEHLLSALRELYSVSTDWDGELYCGVSINWDYHNRHVDISMPGYVEAALHKFQHPAPTRPEDSPHAWNQPTYGAKVQYAEALDTSPRLSAEETTRIQQIIGTFLYYGIAVDPTMLVAIGSIAATQAKATQATLDAIVHFLNYAASHPDAVIRYHASDMILHNHSDGSYLSEPKARSRVGGHFFLSQNPTDPTKPPTTPPRNNGPIHTTCNILRHVMASAAEAEVGALFVNGQDAIPLRNTLIELGHPQPPTPIQTDNSTAAGFANDTIKQKRSKAMDMRFYWIKDRVEQGQFLIYWRPGSENLGDYFTKHHSPSHHRLMRPVFLNPEPTPKPSYADVLRGCVNSASVCAPNSAPRLVRLTPDSASVHPPPSAPRLLRLMKQTICGHSRPTNFKRPITRFVLTS